MSRTAQTFLFPKFLVNALEYRRTSNVYICQGNTGRKAVYRKLKVRFPVAEFKPATARSAACTRKMRRFHTALIVILFCFPNNLSRGQVDALHTDDEESRFYRRTLSYGTLLITRVFEKIFNFIRTDYLYKIDYASI